ncbi:MAG: GEVED domain-containing protein [Pseudobacter sp.]|uniref:GEVED domain-containing protein n=1 Tax=Pseudobacter sp. TaxID=2045420 RepID=UPI003F8143B8
MRNNLKPVLFICFLFIFICFLPHFLHAQPVCGFDTKHRKMQQVSATYLPELRKQEARIREWLNEKAAAEKLSVDGRVPNGPETIYEIPVVIHVIHIGDAVGSDYNPDDAQLTGMLDYLNQSFQATWPGYPTPSTGGTRVPFRFILAQRAPDCTPTTGINRVDGSGIPNYVAGGLNASTALGADDPDVKSLSIWPANQYYNIWIVNKIDGKDGYPGTVGSFTAGYAYFPGAPSWLDGTVMLASQAMAGRKTLPHELGHAFNLYHTFEGAAGATCPPNTDCTTEGDMVCDTDPTNESAFFACPATNNPCTGAPWNGQGNNFMHYTNCGAWRFTPGQRDRMIASMETIRAGLLTSAGLRTPPAQLTASAACAPASITNTGNNNDMGPVRIQFSSIDDSTGSYSIDGLFYLDHSCNMTTSVEEGQTYSLRVSTRTNRQVAKVWIDYNNNGSFEAGEQVMNSTTPAGLPGNDYTHSVDVTIPSGTSLGAPLRLRVVADFIGNPGITACGNQLYGQTEDYSVTINLPGALPVKIYDERIRLQNQVIRFSFKASEESQVIRYELQRAGKQGDAFTSIKSILPADSRTSVNEYSVTDEGATGTGWYRILAIEQNGRKFYSRILGTPSGNSEANGKLSISPNPTNGNINISLPLQQGTSVKLVLRDAQGRIVWAGNRNVERTLVIPGGFPAGMYYLSAIAGQQQWNAKLIVTSK